TFEATAGLTASRRDYTTAVTVGESSQFSPDWKAKLTRPYAGGSATLDYSGNVGLSNRMETRTITTVDPVTLQDVDEVTTSESDETNTSNKLDLAGNYKIGLKTDVNLRSSASRNKFQYLSQVDSLLGQQGTRIREGKNANLQFNTTAIPGVDIKSRAIYTVNETDYALERIRTTKSTTAETGADINYNGWDTGRWIFKMKRTDERRDLQTSQAGDVAKTQASVDYKQDILDNIALESAFFITLDRYEFDDKEANTNDRDLRTRRGSFRVRYNPHSTVTSSVRMEIRQTESIYIQASRSGSNSTDYAYVISPQYTWKLGKANFSGDFTADARYKVQDFQDDSNKLNRVFSTRQKWQQAFNSRFSTEVVAFWEFSDQGSYNRSTLDGRRRFIRTGENRKLRLETKLRYEFIKGFTSRVEYRSDEDDSYIINSGEKSLSNQFPQRQFLYAVDFKKTVMDHIRLDVKFSQTFKDGDNVRETERNFYSIRAQLTYDPFKPKKEN
ncbi:MAG: hypothetical protein HKN12_09600, partial [Gemmatimonadetes bacterium]|nr:hypothetical protein [Gemmatimonadota bacterium]